MPQVTEYRINPIDKYGDIIDPQFFDRLNQAREALPEILSQFENQCVEWEIEKQVRKFASDGELRDEVRSVIEKGQYDA